MNSKRWPRISRLTRCVVTLLTVVAFLTLIQRLNDPSDESTSGSKCLLLVVLLLILLPDLLRSGKIYFSFRNKISEEIRHRRSSCRHIPYLLLRYLMPTLALYISYDRLWTVSSVGIASGSDYTGACVVGVFAAFVFDMIQQFKNRYCASRETPSSHEISTIRLNLPRGRVARSHARLDLVVISPAFEELLYRGFFVFFINELLGTFVIGMALGLVLCMWVHLYQGIPNLISVLLFFIFAVLLLYSPFGLLSSFAFHATCNLQYTLRHQQLVEWYVDTVRSRRSRPRSTTFRELNSV